jgi:hypothetical protein
MAPETRNPAKCRLKSVLLPVTIAVLALLVPAFGPSLEAQYSVMSGLQGHLSAFTFRRCDLSSFLQKTVSSGSLARQVDIFNYKG